MTQLPTIHTDLKPTPANVARIEAEKRDGAKTFRAGQKVTVNPGDGTDPAPATVVELETGGRYGNIVKVRFADGTEKRVVASRVTKRK